MKNLVRLFGLLGMMGGLFLGKMEVCAADQGFIELPVEEIQVVIRDIGRNWNLER